jgi:hypothetical protein
LHSSSRQINYGFGKLGERYFCVLNSTLQGAEETFNTGSHLLPCHLKNQFRCVVFDVFIEPGTESFLSAGDSVPNLLPKEILPVFTVHFLPDQSPEQTLHGTAGESCADIRTQMLRAENNV